MKQAPRTQTATPEKGGTFECQNCLKFYAHANESDRRYHNVVRAFVKAIWPNRMKWADEFLAITGESLTEYVARQRSKSNG